MSKTKVKTTISIDSELYQEIANDAKKEDRSFSRQLSYRLKKSKELAYQTDLAKIQAELKE